LSTLTFDNFKCLQKLTDLQVKMMEAIWTTVWATGPVVLNFRLVVPGAEGAEAAAIQAFLG
jgi:hypothetical protein